jgi:isopenicillin-N epimerase
VERAAGVELVYHSDMFEMRRHWSLDPTLTFLNHGSFGACPRAVLDYQAELRKRLEASPVQFMHAVPEELERLRKLVGPFVGADPADIVFVRNATEGVNAVLRSLRFQPGDELLTSNHAYPACVNALRFVAQQSGASVKVVPLPFPLESSDQIVAAFRGALTPRTRLCLLDHITSATALVLPVAAIARVLREHGVASLVDGAHAAGMVELDVRALGVDYYATNFHKWTCAPKGAGMLWVRPELRQQILPSVVSHGFTEPEPRRFQAMFDWTGTSDPTAWLCLGRTLEFMGSLLPGGWRQLREENHRLALQARDTLCAALACPRPAPDELIGSMASIPLRPGKPEPADAELPAHRSPDPLYRELSRRGFEVVIANWPAKPARVLRVSAQLYNTLDEYERLAQALQELS